MFIIIISHECVSALHQLAVWGYVIPQPNLAVLMILLVWTSGINVVVDNAMFKWKNMIKT